MITLLLLTLVTALLVHVVVSTAVDSYDSYGDNGPDFRI
jgi:hypothetical protein